MNKSVDNILSQVYELEGLLLLVENHGKNTNNFVLDLIRQKAQKIAELSHLVEVETAAAMQSSLDIQDEIIENRLEQEEEDIQENIFDEECKVKEPFFKATTTFEMLGSDTCCDTDEDEIDVEELNDDLFDNNNTPSENCLKKEFSAGNSFIDFNASVETLTPETSTEEIIEIEDILDNDDNDVDYIDDEETDDNDYDNTSSEDTVKKEFKVDNSFIGFSTSIEAPTPAPKTPTEEIIEDDDQQWSIEDHNQEDEFIEEPETISNTIADDYNSIIDPEEIEEFEEFEIEEIYPDDEEEIDEEIDEEEEEILTVEETLARNLSKNLRQAFTLNDRFRYRRELFGNSDVEMTNTLNLVEAMDSYAEAEDYFYGDLEWDKESSEVVDFMTIIRNHFA